MTRRHLVLTGSVLIGSLILGILYWTQDRQSSTLANPAVEGSVAYRKEQKEAVHLDEKTLKEFGIETAAAGPGNLTVVVALPGEVALNADRLAHIVPWVPGVVRRVYKNLGDQVRAGDLLAVIDSRDLADLKAAYLAAHERLDLAEATFTREEGLWQKKISAEQDYLNARRDLAEAGIALRASEQKLHAIGLSEPYLAELPKLPHESFTGYEMAAPLDGTIIEKHIVLGEVLRDDAECFIIADLNSVWVDLNVHQKDLPRIHVGQKVVIFAGSLLEAQGMIAFVSSQVSEQTRTTLARVVMPNPDGLWRAGLYVTAKVLVEEVDVPLRVPNEALTRMDGTTVVFVRANDGFRPQPVATGRSDGTHTEVISGLTAGQSIVTRGAFTLKSELLKSTAEE